MKWECAFFFFPSRFLCSTYLSSLLKEFYLLIIIFLVVTVDTHVHLYDLSIPSASFSMSVFCYIINYDIIVDVL